MPNEPDVRTERFGTTYTSDDFSQCLRCTHYDADAERECAAFEGKIPMEILTGDFDHRDPHPDDNGLRFEPEDEPHQDGAT